MRIILPLHWGYEYVLWTVKWHTYVTFLLFLLDHFSLHSPHFNVVLFSWEFCLYLYVKSLPSTICTSKSVYSTSPLSCTENGCFLFIMEEVLFHFVLIDLVIKGELDRRSQASMQNPPFVPEAPPKISDISNSTSLKNVLKSSI